MTELLQTYTLAVLATLAAWQEFSLRRLRKRIADLERHSTYEEMMQRGAVFAKLALEGRLFDQEKP